MKKKNIYENDLTIYLLCLICTLQISNSWISAKIGKNLKMYFLLRTESYLRYYNKYYMERKLDCINYATGYVYSVEAFP